MKSEAIIEKIRAKLAAVDPEKRTIFKVFQFNLNDSDGALLKSVVLDLNELKVYEGTYENPDGEVTITDEDFFAVTTKAVPVMELLAADKIQLNGDLEAIKKLLDNLHE